MATNPTRELGRTGIAVTPLGLGCWQFASEGLMSKHWGVMPEDEVDAVVRAALAGGINWFDTAQVYGGGTSEQRLAQALVRAGKKNGDVVVATKWYPMLKTAEDLLQTAEERARCLAPFQIDLHQVHQPFSLSSIEMQMDAMAQLVKEGKIRAVGVSNFSAPQLRQAHAALAKHGLPLASNQMSYSLLNRRVEKDGVMQACKELGVTLMAYSPLAQGVLTGRYHDDDQALERLEGSRRDRGFFARAKVEKAAPVVKELKAIAAAHGATPAQVALAWLLQVHGDTVVAIPGASKVKQVADLTAALELTLTQAEMTTLDHWSYSFL